VILEGDLTSIFTQKWKNGSYHWQIHEADDGVVSSLVLSTFFKYKYMQEKHEPVLLKWSMIVSRIGEKKLCIVPLGGNT
jgi:hypothetical protein